MRRGGNSYASKLGPYTQCAGNGRLTSQSAFGGMENFAESNLQHAGMELRFRHGTTGVSEGRDQDSARLVGLNDRIDPAAGGAVTHVGLLGVVAFHLFAQGVELRGRS